MSMTIPSPVLARLQVMFSAGATMEEAAHALEIELGEGGGATAIDADELKALKAHTRALGKKVDSLFQLKRLRDVPEVAGALDLIAHESRGIIRAAKALEARPDKEKSNADPAVRKTRRSKPASRPSGPGARSSRPSADAPTVVSRPSVQEATQSPPREMRPETTPAKPASVATAAPSREASAVPAPSHLDALASELTADPAPSTAAPSAVRTAPSATPVDAPPAPKPAPHVTASRPSPGRPSRNALSNRIANVVDEISAITADHEDEAQPSAVR